MRERPSLHALAVFLAVVEHGTMTAAAEVESISQPAISAHVKGLEGFFGTPLLERSGRRVRPTAAGHLVADYSRRLVALADEMSRGVDDLRGLQAGKLVVGASSTVGEQMLPEVLGRFHRAYPAVQLVLRIGNTDEIVQAVRERELDLGIVGREQVDRDLICRPVFDDHLDIFVAPDSPLAGQERVGLDQLHGETFVLREAGSATRDLALRCLAAHGCAPGDTIELGSNEAVKRAVSAGLGIGVLSTHTVRIDRQAGAVVVLDCAGWDCQRHFWLIYRVDRYPTSAERVFIDMLA
jgi:DNA-binding transcriptional LysR family regulator